MLMLACDQTNNLLSFCAPSGLLSSINVLTCHLVRKVHRQQDDWASANLSFSLLLSLHSSPQPLCLPVWPVSPTGSIRLSNKQLITRENTVNQLKFQRTSRWDRGWWKYAAPVIIYFTDCSLKVFWGFRQAGFSLDAWLADLWIWRWVLLLGRVSISCRLNIKSQACPSWSFGLFLLCKACTLL